MLDKSGCKNSFVKYTKIRSLKFGMAQNEELHCTKLRPSVTCGCLCISTCIPIGLEWFNEFCSYLLHYLCLWVKQILTFIATQHNDFLENVSNDFECVIDPPPPHILQSLNVLRHVCWKPELWSQQRKSSLGSSSVNMSVAKQWLSSRHMKAVTNTQVIIQELLEEVFSMQPVSRLYNEDQLPLPVSLNTQSREESSESAGRQSVESCRS
jgi:hypothetical protein